MKLKTIESRIALFALVLACIAPASFLFAFGSKEADAGKAEREAAFKEGLARSAAENPVAAETPSPAGAAAKSEVAAPPTRGLWDGAKDGQTVLLTGTVRLVGNEPFTENVITDGEDKDWYLSDADREAVGRFEQQTVTVQATVTLKDMVLANGKNRGTRRILSNVVLVK